MGPGTARKTDHLNWLAAVDALADPTPPPGPDGLTAQQRRIVTAAVTLGRVADYLLGVIDNAQPAPPDHDDEHLMFWSPDLDLAAELSQHPSGLRVDDDLRSASLFGHPLEVRVGADARVRTQLRATLTALIPPEALGINAAFASCVSGRPCVGMAGPIINSVCVTSSAAALLRTTRIATPRTRTVMAAHAGVAPHTIRYWETGLPDITAHALAAATSLPTPTTQLAIHGIRDTHWPHVTPDPPSLAELHTLETCQPAWC